MIFAIKKYKHHLLANKFVFFINHQALWYLINKLCNTGRIVSSFLILLKFDFTIIVKEGNTHLRAVHLSHMTHGEIPNRVDDNLPNSYLF